MKRARIALLLIMAAHPAWGGETASCEHNKSTFRCVKAIRNYDGDTLTVRIPGVHPLIGENISVRVRGVDTPEVKGRAPCEKDTARTAKRLVHSLLRSAKRIDLVDVERDKYFRILADVIVDGRSVRDVLLKEKLAYSYDGGKKRDVNWCELGRARVPAAAK